MDIAKIRSEFPLFKTNPNLVYLDSAATALTQQGVIDAMHEYYAEYGANIHRGLYNISAKATEKYEEARDIIAEFINAQREEVIFTSGTTAALNMLATSLDIQKGDNIVLTRSEHHANLVPWQQLGVELRFIELEKSEIRNQGLGTLDVESARELIDQNTKIVSFASVSNVLGTRAPIKEIISSAKEVNAITIIDHAQGVVHASTDVKELDCDFLVFSGHKLYGPTGIGILYGKKERLEAMQPSTFGGDMIEEVTYEKSTWAVLPNKFEAGTPNIAGAIGLAAGIKFVESIGWDEIVKHEADLSDYLHQELSKIDGLQIYGKTSFTVNDIHPHDMAEILNSVGVAVRAGHHCAMPLMKHLGIHGTTRASLGIYNSKEGIDQLVLGINGAKALFGLKKAEDIVKDSGLHQQYMDQA